MTEKYSTGVFNKKMLQNRFVRIEKNLWEIHFGIENDLLPFALILIAM